MERQYDNIDLRVRSLAEARPFYETLLPALGFTRDVRIESSGYSSKQPGRTVRLSFLVSPSHHGIQPMNAGSPSGQTVRARSTAWLRSSSGPELGMSKVLGITKDRATMRSFSRIPVAIGWKSAIEPKEPDRRNDC